MILAEEHYQGKHTIYHVKKVFDLNAETATMGTKTEEGGGGGVVDDLMVPSDDKGFQIAVHQHRGVFKCKYKL